MQLCVALGVAALLATIVALKVKFNFAGSPHRMEVINDIIAGRSIGYSPYSVGYHAFVAYALRWFGTKGVVAAQALLYCAVVLFSYLTLAGFPLAKRLALPGAIAVALYPNMLFSISRLVDTGAACFLLAAFAWLVMRLKRDGLSVVNCLISGVLIAAMLLVRPNGLTLLPVALWAAFRRRRFEPASFARLCIAAAVAVGLAAAVVIPLKGRFVLFDRYYAAYTLANGTHPLALEGMLRDYNGEMAMPEAMQRLGLPFHDLSRTDPAAADEYTQMVWTYVREHPVDYAGLEVAKLVNLFRPDYRNAEHSFVPAPVGVAIHTLIALLFPIWLALRWVCRREFRLGDGLIAIPMLLLFIAPFVATASDPRYRVPFDTVFIVDSATCVAILDRRRRSDGREALEWQDFPASAPEPARAGAASAS